jgi:hypothetical protein
MFETLNHSERRRLGVSKILVGTQSHKTTIGVPMSRTRCGIVPAVLRTERLQPGEDLAGPSRWEVFGPSNTPAPCKRAEMDQIQILAGPIGTQVSAERVQRQVSVQSLKPCQCKDGVIKIRPSFAVPSRAFRAELGLEKLGNQRGGIA